nr:hypothetical protein Iba_chr07cCG10180 [Ipomoea batatas]
MVTLSSKLLIFFFTLYIRRPKIANPIRAAAMEKVHTGLNLNMQYFRSSKGAFHQTTLFFSTSAFFTSTSTILFMVSPPVGTISCSFSVNTSDPSHKLSSFSTTNSLSSNSSNFAPPYPFPPQLELNSSMLFFTSTSTSTILFTVSPPVGQNSSEPSRDNAGSIQFGLSDAPDPAPTASAAATVFKYRTSSSTEKPKGKTKETLSSLGTNQITVRERERQGKGENMSRTSPGSSNYNTGRGWFELTPGFGGIGTHRIRSYDSF